jgi:hypothetical protein
VKAVLLARFERMRGREFARLRAWTHECAQQQRAFHKRKRLHGSNYSSFSAFRNQLNL